MRLSVVGTGYVGLVSGACLADKGHDVTCVDISEARVRQINEGVAPIHEDGLPELLDRNVGTRLRATSDLREAVLGSDISLIAVGTPYLGDQIDLQYIRAAAQQIGEVLRDKDGYHVVVVKSTVVPGTTEDVVLPILEQSSGKRAGVDFGVGMNPEFLREGAAVRDFMEPDRIVLGGIDERTLAALGELYAPFTGVDVVPTTPRTAEMIKYTANSLLATLISFANEIGNLCSTIGGIDVVEVMRGVHLDHRLNPVLDDGRRAAPVSLTYLEAGCGFGGSCFPKDVKAMIAHGRRHSYEPRILQAAIAVNEAQPSQMVGLLRRHLPDLEGRPVTVLGAAFKPGTDDVRESPALRVVEELLDAGAAVTVHDPIALENFRPSFGDKIRCEPDLGAALAGAEGVMLVTSWPEYRDLPSRLGPDQAVVVDGRRMFDPSAFARYEGIGR